MEGYSAVSQQTSSARYPIRVAAVRAGLTPPVLRAWERRYGAVTPERTGGRHRTFSVADIERLKLLRRVTEAGHLISQVARYSDEALLELLADHEAAGGAAEQPGPEPAAWQRPPSVEACLEAARELDGEGLLFQLERALVDLGPAGALGEVATPLVRRLEGGLREHRLRPMHREMASAVVRSFCDLLIRRHHPPASAPVLLVAGPRGQDRDADAYLLSAFAVLEGWRVFYLGVGLAAEEIVAAARKTSARAVVLSLPRPADARLGEEVLWMRRHLEPAAAVLAEGPVVEGTAAELEAAGVTRIVDPGRLGEVLSRLIPERPDQREAQLFT